MIGDILIVVNAHPFAAGLLIGAMGFGGALGVIGWCLGYEAAMRKTADWLRPKAKAASDVPELPPVRERRFIPTVGRM